MKRMKRSQGLFVATKLCRCKLELRWFRLLEQVSRWLISINIENKQTNLYLVMCHVWCHSDWFPFVTNEMSDIEQSNGFTFLLIEALCAGATNCYDSTKVYSTNLTFNYLLFLTLWYHKPNLTGSQDTAATNSNRIRTKFINPVIEFT